MSGRWGFRLRWGLLATMVALLAARYVTSRCWVNRSVVVGGGGPPAVLVALSSSHRTIEKWDWNTNRMESIATFEGGPIAGMLCTDDGKFVWLDDGTLHTIELDPPHEHRQWKTAFSGDEDSSQLSILGTSPNSRLVAVQCVQPDFGAPFHFRESDLVVIDVETAEEVSRKHWNSRMGPAIVSGEFESFSQLARETPEEPRHGEWRLTDQGTWELLPPDSNRYDFVQVVKDAAGRVRGVLLTEPLSPGENLEGTAVAALSPDGEHVLRRNRKLFLAHAGRRDVQALPTRISDIVRASFTDDGKHFLVDDVFGDVQVYESETGRLVSSTTSGMTWHSIVAGLAATFVVIAFGWLWLSFREKTQLGTIVDFHAAAIAAQIAIFSFIMQLQFLDSQWLVDLCASVGFTATAALGVATGWYWTYGPGDFAVKLKWGFLSILAIAIVPTFALASLEAPYYMQFLLLIPAFAGLFAASVTAFLLSPIRVLGWQASDEPVPFQARRFSLASMMLVIAGVSVVLAFLKFTFDVLGAPDVLGVAMVFLPIAVAGLFLPAIAIMNAGLHRRILLGIGVAASISGGIMAGTDQRVGNWIWSAYVAMYCFVATTMLVILAMAILARKHGWRWRKAQALAGDVPSLERAA